MNAHDGYLVASTIPAQLYGEVTVYPTSPVPAGTYGTWTITYTVGRFGIDNGGGIKIVLKQPSDWGRPQLDAPAEPNYVRVFASRSTARLTTHWSDRTHVRPWPTGLTIRVFDDSLAKNDTITIVWGDTSGGGLGSQAQTFADDAFEFRTLVDCFGTGLYLPLNQSPTFEVVGGQAATLTAVAPTDAVVGEPTWLIVRAQDMWGNPARDFTGTVRIDGQGWSGLPTRHVYGKADGGVYRFGGLIPLSSGVARLKVMCENPDVSIASNPIRCYDSRPDVVTLWGDTQGQTGSTVGTGTVSGFFRYARDAAGLDFVAHSANDFQITADHYEETRRAVKDFHQPGEFVTFVSYEWSGNTPVGGDHNVIFLHDEQAPLFRSSHALILQETDVDTDRITINELHTSLRQEGIPALLIPHVGGRLANLDLVDPELSPVIEIASVHGWFEWFAQDALERGMKVGFIGASDDHTGRAGASYPTRPAFAVRNGLAGVYATELSRDAIWKALQARHCFATTGERIRVSILCGRSMMGDEIAVESAPRFDVEVDGTQPLESVEIIRDRAVIYQHAFPEYDDVLTNSRLRVAWRGARIKGRGRHFVWDGRLEISGGRILDANFWSVGSPKHGIRTWSDREVVWESSTSGNGEGVILDVDVGQSATLHYLAGGVDRTIALSDVGVRPWRWTIGEIERELELRWLPRHSPAETARFSFTDDAVPSGEHAYYLRVRQADGSMAWSSPIYVEVAGAS